jgi:hypothetical protein
MDNAGNVGNVGNVDSDSDSDSNDKKKEEERCREREATKIEIVDRYMRDFAVFAAIFALRAVLKMHSEDKAERKERVDFILSQWTRKQKAGLARGADALHGALSGQNIDIEALHSDSVKAVDAVADIVRNMLMDD